MITARKSVLAEKKEKKYNAVLDYALEQTKIYPISRVADKAVNKFDLCHTTFYKIWKRREQ